MEKEDKNQNVGRKPPELMKWSELKKSRCPRTRRILRDHANSDKHISPLLPTTRLSRNCEGAALQQSENRKTGSGSPEKEDRNYMTTAGLDENSIDKAGGSTDGGGGGEKHRQRERGIHVEEENRISRRRLVWPKLYITLSSKEKEEDFMAMKGCKPPHRPKKRAKIIQRTLLRPRGLKAMGSVESDSE